MIRIGVIGCGYWGQNLIRNFSEVDDAAVVACCDISPERLRKIQQRYPAVWCTQSHEELLRAANVDAVLIATPVSTHYPLARAALERHKHVLVEKPLADSSAHTLDLIARAARLHRVLMVDHTFVYTSAVRKIREMIDAGELGDLLYFDSVRVNLGLFQRDINVVWDLAPHDLSIADFLLRRKPLAITVVGTSHTANHIVNMAYLTLMFPNNLLVHLHVNWLAPVKIRQTLIGGSRRMIVYNDVEPTEKVRVYDKGVVFTGSPEERYQVLIDYRVGDVSIPKLDTTEALKRVAQEFVSAITEDRRPLTDGAAGFRVVRLLETAQASLDSGGRVVEIDGEWLDAADPQSDVAAAV